jgi:nucleoside-diphosphate-sugar epimerase
MRVFVAGAPGAIGRQLVPRLVAAGHEVHASNEASLDGERRPGVSDRERYVGEWLPEPIISDGPDDPAQQAEMADSLSLAVLVVLESLSPERHAVLLLDGAISSQN